MDEASIWDAGHRRTTIGLLTLVTLIAFEAMAVGTAGYTAMLALMALERHGLRPDRGPAVVTGA